MNTDLMTAEMGKEILARLDSLRANSKPFFTVPEAAKFLDVSVDSIRNYINAGEIAYSRPGGRRILISREDIDAFIRRSRKPSKAEIEEMASTRVIMGQR